jgi:hypothetical protein
MIWPEIRKVYPHQWIIVEALEAHTNSNSRRQIGRLAVIESCPDGSMAMKRYRELHKQYPLREFYFVHTDRPELDIYERQWVGIRRDNAITAER